MNNDLKGALLVLESGQTFCVEGNRLLIECEPDKDEYAPGIIKADAQKRYSRWGKVVQVGDNVDVNIYPLETGDRVCFEAYNGVDLEINKIDYKILTPLNVLCKEVL